MGDRKNRYPRRARRRVEQALDVQGLPLGPGRKSRGGCQIVQTHGQGEAVLGREERLQRQDADPIQAGFLNRMDDGHQIQIAARTPFAVHDIGQQDMLPGLQGVRVYPRQRQQARDGCGNAISQAGRVIDEFRRGGVERGQNGERQAGPRTRRIDGEIGGGFQAGDALPILPPGGQSVCPGCSRFGR